MEDLRQDVDQAAEALAIAHETQALQKQWT
jgi:hypothetical protein